MASTPKTLSVLVMLLLLAGLSVNAPVALADIDKGDAPQGMFALYKQNRVQGIPNYITEDFMLLSHGMVINEVITMLEETVLMPQFQQLTTALVEDMTTAKTELTVADKANFDFLSVLTCLLDGTEQPEAAVDKDAVVAELKKIRAAKGIDNSTLMQQKIDYSQFIVRGKYTRNENLGRYFQAMRYAGTVLFPVLESKATGVTAKQADALTGQAMALAMRIHGNQELESQHNRIEKQLAWIFGSPDDLTHSDYVEIATDDTITEKRLALLNLARETDRQPKIIAGMVDVDKLEEGRTVQDVMTGFRFMSQRFTPDSAAMQQLIFNQVTKYQGQKDPFSRALIDGSLVKGFPLGLELMALLGSAEAQFALDSNDERNYTGYVVAANKARSALLTSSGLSSEYMQLMHQWLNAPNNPQVAVDGLRRLNSCLGFWTYTRYISVLYAKQSYTPVAKSFEKYPARNQAWLSPAPGLYLHLQHQAMKLRQTLPADVDHPMAERLEKYIQLLEKCRAIAFKELRQVPLTVDEVGFLNQLDTELAYIVINPDQPIVTDVHTEPNSQLVLQEGLGYPRTVTFQLQEVNARGALFNYYEFKHSMQDRLTDAKWQVLLADDEAMEQLKLSPGSTQNRF